MNDKLLSAAETLKALDLENNVHGYLRGKQISLRSHSCLGLKREDCLLDNSMTVIISFLLQLCHCATQHPSSRVIIGYLRLFFADGSRMPCLFRFIASLTEIFGSCWSPPLDHSLEVICWINRKSNVFACTLFSTGSCSTERDN